MSVGSLKKKSFDVRYRPSKWTYTQNKSKKVLIFEKNRKEQPPTTSSFLGLGFDTVMLEFWVPLEKTQVFTDGYKDLFESMDPCTVGSPALSG